MVTLGRFFKYLKPMTFEGYAFTDGISGKRIYYYRDAFGKRWMKEGRFGLFKVAACG